MPDLLPPLNALRAFESSARHLSFTRAARELHVTQSAVSHQVKALETHLGYALFIRKNRSLFLTEEGAQLALAATEAFTHILDATQRIADRQERGILTVSLSTSLAHRWLMPRLHSFTDAHPDIDIRLSAEDRLIDFHVSDVDLAIRYGPGHYPGLAVKRLLVDDVFPVAAASLIPGPYPKENATCLSGLTLLDDDKLTGFPGRPSWKNWFESMGWGAPPRTRELRFSHATLTLQAAIRGQGVALGRSTLVQDDLESGRLIRPFRGSFKSSFAYHIVKPRNRVQKPRVLAFEKWVLDEAESARGFT